MTGPGETRLRHLGGLALVLALLALCWGLWVWVPVWVRGTFAQDLGLLVTFLGWIALLTAADRLWTALTGQKGH